MFGGEQSIMTRWTIIKGFLGARINLCGRTAFLGLLSSKIVIRLPRLLFEGTSLVCFVLFFQIIFFYRKQDLSWFY